MRTPTGRAAAARRIGEGRARKGMAALALGFAAAALSCSSGRYVDGRYEGLSALEGGRVALAVEIRGGRIVGIDALPGEPGIESHGLFEGALAEIEKSVLAAQSAEVDSVAGATVSSGGIKAAVAAALKKAARRD